MLFFNYIFTGETRCAGCLCTSSGLFKRIEPPRTFSNHIIAKIARCVEFFYMSSEWFDYSEPSLTTSFQGKQGVQGAYCALVRAHRTSSNLLEPHNRRDSTKAPCTPCFSSKYVDRGGSVQSNHPEPMLKTLHTLLYQQ